MNQLTSSTIAKAAVREVPTKPAPIPEGDIISGQPESTMAVLWRSPDSTHYNGVWQCTPGVFMLTHPAETICVVEGRATVTPQGGEPVTLQPGDIAFIPEGTVARWEVHETVRKAFHSHDSSGAMLGDF
jgi:uncharacterized protein